MDYYFRKETQMSIRNRLDKYYFDHDLGEEQVVTIIKENPKAEVFIEPAGGDGAFSNPLHRLLGKEKRCIAIDIKPEASNIIKYNFFIFPWKKYFLPGPGKVVSVVSAPFGRNNKLATKFFNNCAKRSDTIYFVCSRVFKKPHIHKRLNEYFHLERSEDLPETAFIVDGEPCKLRCCIQKWVRKDVKREVVIKRKSKYFDFVKKHEPCNFIICYTGAKTGKIVSTAYKKVYRLKFKPKYEHMVNYITNNIDLDEAANNTIGIKSVTKYEIVKEIEHIIKNSTNVRIQGNFPSVETIKRI